jgi:hypothetical protein
MQFTKDVGITTSVPRGFPYAAFPRSHGGPTTDRETRTWRTTHWMKETTMTKFNDRLTTLTITLATIALTALLSFQVATSLAPPIV